MAKKRRVNRSTLVRAPLGADLKEHHFRELERREREAYERTPDDPTEAALWERVAEWPQD